MKIAYLMKDRPDYFHRLDESSDYVIAGAEPDGTYSPETLAEVADVDAIIVSTQPQAVASSCPSGLKDA